MTTLIISSIIALLVIAGAAILVARWMHNCLKNDRLPSFSESDVDYTYTITEADRIRMNEICKIHKPIAPNQFMVINLDEVRRLLKESGAGPTQFFYNGRPMTWADLDEMRERQKAQLEWLKSEREDEEKGGNKLIWEAKEILKQKQP